MDPENWDAWELWQAAGTQWRSNGMGGPAGLDYTALYLVAGTMGIQITPQILYKIRALEAAVISKRNKKPAPTSPGNEEGET